MSEALGGPSGSTTYTYDPVDNRLKALDTGCNSTTDASYTYDGDGKRASQPFGFSGEQRAPENSLVYLRARYLLTFA